MKYVSGIHALNLPCAIDTAGDWHAPSQDWDAPWVLISDESIFGSWGIETNRTIPFASTPQRLVNIANHIRACLDLLEHNRLTLARGMREGFIDNENYTPMVFELVERLKDVPHWPAINKLMIKEYGLDWLHRETQNAVA